MRNILDLAIKQSNEAAIRETTGRDIVALRKMESGKFANEQRA